MNRNTTATRQGNDSLVLNYIFQGKVTGIKPFGAFIKIPGSDKNGLVHISHLSKCRVEKVEEILQIGDTVWCKIISIDDSNSKIGLSMKYVDQGTGKDLDPAGVQKSQDERKRKIIIPKESSKITLDAIYNTVCKKCGTKGHLAQNCFQTPGSKVYELISEEELNTSIDPEGQSSSTETSHKKRKKKHKDSKSKKRHKASHEHKHKSHRHS